MLDKIVKVSKFFFEPRIALFIFVSFLLATLIFLDVEGAFVGNFLKFGPGKTEEDTATFLHMKLDTWTKVIIVYFIAFFVSIMRSYYQTVMFDFIHSYAWNPAIKKINYSKKWTYLIGTVEPLLYFLLSIIEFYILFTRQLQFILIQFLGSAIIDIPYTLYRLSTKKFSSP
jgi:hypothetical protein